MSTNAEVQATRAGVGLFALGGRGVISVTGGDRVRWLNGMISNDVAVLEAGSSTSGCYALVLTQKGRITADLQVLLRPDCLWLETARDAVAGLIERLERYIVADDVALEDCSESFERIGVEGPEAFSLLAAAAGQEVALSANACMELQIAGQSLVVAAFGWSGEPALQLFAGPGSCEPILACLEEHTVGALVRGGPEALEILRIEAGIPRLGAELDEEVLPDEARLDRAISHSKGCYTGQEIVARLHSRGQVNHLLVGLQFDGPAPPADTDLQVDSVRTGEVTSSCESPARGAIGLGYVHRKHSEPGTPVQAGSVAAQVVALPFVSTARLP